LRDVALENFAAVKLEPGADDARQRRRCPSAFILWRRTCWHQAEPDAAEMVARYGAGTAVLEGRERLVCSRCGSQGVGLLVSRIKSR
jgi:hypothetical protein